MNDIELLQINIINNVKNELHKKDIKEDMYLDYLFKNKPFNKKEYQIL